MAARKTQAAGAKRKAGTDGLSTTAVKKARNSPAPAPTKSKAQPKPKAMAVRKRKATPTPTPPPPAPTATKPAASKKRKATDDTTAPASKKAKPLVKGAIINQPPTQRLHIFVMGEGENGELGLGTSKKATSVKRPRLNPFLLADQVGVTKIKAGGMHALALTHDNKILSWGVNDQGALGRDTTWDGGLRDMDAPEDSDSEAEDDNNGQNPKECTPGEVDFSQTPLAPNTRFTDIAAGDSCSFAVTDDGRVYGWGTFRKSDGILGFTKVGDVCYRPVLIQGLSNITDVATGANHAIALDKSGAVRAWGSGEQSQLGRRAIVRHIVDGLTPRLLGLPKGTKNGIASISSGNDHSFAISKNGAVYAWGNNTGGATGIKQFAGMENAVVTIPTVIEELQDKTVVSISGGAHHSIAATSEGECLVWGRCDNAGLGIEREDVEKLPEEDVVRDIAHKRRIVINPIPVPNLDAKVVSVGASGDTSMVTTKDGSAWSWGFSINYQTGLGVDDDVTSATKMGNAAINGKHLLGAECGGQYSILYAAADNGTALPNGI